MTGTSGRQRPPRLQASPSDKRQPAEVVPLRRASKRACALETFLAHVRWHRGKAPSGTAGAGRPEHWDGRRLHPSSGDVPPDDVA